MSTVTSHIQRSWGYLFYPSIIHLIFILILLKLSGNVEHISALAIMSLPETLFSGYSIGTSLTTAGEVQEVLDQLKELQINRIDTTASWPRASPGYSETLLGEVQASGQGFKIDTRISRVTVSSSAPRGARPSQARQ